MKGGCPISVPRGLEGRGGGGGVSPLSCCLAAGHPTNKLLFPDISRRWSKLFRATRWHRLFCQEGLFFNNRVALSLLPPPPAKRDSGIAPGGCNCLSGKLPLCCNRHKFAILTRKGIETHGNHLEPCEADSCASVDSVLDVGHDEVLRSSHTGSEFAR